jgi:hypothetical protein
LYLPEYDRRFCLSVRQTPSIRGSVTRRRMTWGLRGKRSFAASSTELGTQSGQSGNSMLLTRHPPTYAPNVPAARSAPSAHRLAMCRLARSGRRTALSRPEAAPIVVVEEARCRVRCNVPASRLKSSTCSVASSPNRQPVSNAARTRFRNSPSAVLMSRRHSSIVRYLTRAARLPRKARPGARRHRSGSCPRASRG